MTGLFSSETLERRRGMLRTALGQAITMALNDPGVIEVMVNPDGVLRLDRLVEGIVETGIQLMPAEVERIIRLVASHVHAEIHVGNPILSAELPPHEPGLAGERFEAIIPPVSLGPCFAIRKPASKVFTLKDYVSDRMMTLCQADLLRRAVREHKNIVIAGGTSSGKTTLANALLAEIAQMRERVILIEDRRELQCAAPDKVPLRTIPGVVLLNALVRSAMGLRPTRIIVGEVRGPEALDLLKAWNTGHPGGLATVHANSARATPYRLEQLIQEAVITVPRSLIVEAVDLIVFIAGRGLGRRIETIAQLDGVEPDGTYRLTELLTLPKRHNQEAAC